MNETTSSLGKRKDREDNKTTNETTVKGHGSTLFVSNLPYTATSTDLKTLFSDLAPVRSAFVVLDTGSGISKGVGYVSFAIKEDAQAAYDKISNEGITLDDRNLRVQWAEQKHKDKSAKEPTVKQESKTPVPRPNRQSSTPRDPLAIRTVVITGLPSSIDSKQIWKKIRKMEGAEKVEWPTTDKEGHEDRSTAHAVFTKPSAASEAVNKLHAHVFKGALLSATLKKRLDGLAKAPKKPQLAKPGGPTPNRASRLIVRNLPWDIKEQDLRAIFLPYGPIHSIDIPSVRASDEVKEEDGELATHEMEMEKPKLIARSKGFAFVWMLSRKDAEHAMEGCNGMTVQAGLAEQLVADKQKRKKQLREEKKMKKAAEAVKGDSEAEESSEEEDTGPQARTRVIAVDWALSKDKWEKEKAKMAQESEDQEDVEMKDVASEDGSAESDEEAEQIGVHQDSDDDEDAASESEEEDGSSAEETEHGEELPTKPVLPPPETGTTLFVRNVPYEASEDELRTLFRAFGPLRYARITMDHDIGRSRGTGFVCFWNKIDADKAAEQSELLRTETVGDKVAQPKKNPFKLPSLLTPDPSASIAQNLVLHGRTLDVIRAVTRDEAGKLKEEGEKQREKSDKRNLYLLREGIILPNTPAAESMGPAEVEKRSQSYNARRALLKSNPSLYVSKTRLSLRQLPLFVTERMLKRLAIHAVRAFEKEVKEGLRQSLSEDELSEAPLILADTGTVEEDGEAAQKKFKGKGYGRNTGVQQAKIVRQTDRVDPVTGKGRSRGYGFLEMMKHADALRVLRWANNNLAAGKLFEEWWKAELEDLIKIEKKKDKKDEARLKRFQDELSRGAPVKSRGTLIVEFSIENVQVVQRRTAQQREKRQPKSTEAKGPKRRLSLPEVKAEPTPDRPIKQRRLTEARTKTKDTSKPQAKSDERVGSLIGRKRKERKSKKQKS